MATEPYDFREPDGWAAAVAGFKQRRLDDGALIILYGDCPRCGDFMDVELPITLQTGGLRVTDKTDGQTLEGEGGGSRSFEKTAHCNCRATHDGRPEDVTEGCGAFGKLTIG